jgi:ligand-binding sensor domain-containing protein
MTKIEVCLRAFLRKEGLMVRKILCICMMITACIYAQDVVDSMDIGDNTMEWRSFLTDAPAVAFAKSGNLLWYATAAGVGAYTIDRNDKVPITGLGKMSTQGVTAIVADRSGVWLGSQEGIAYTKSGKKFKNYTKKDGLAANAITCMHVARNGTVWAGTKKGVSAYSVGSWKSYTTAQGLCGNDIRDITSNSGGRVFFATNAGIAIYKTGEWKKFNENTGLSSNNVKAVAWDERKGYLWAAVGESDINSFNGKEWDDFMDVQEGITCIMVDTQSRVWVGSLTGIIKYNGFEWVYDQAKMPFPAQVCNSMYRDSRGNLWYAIDTGVMFLNNPYPY